MGALLQKRLPQGAPTPGGMEAKPVQIGRLYNRTALSCSTFFCTAYS